MYSYTYIIVKYKYCHLYVCSPGVTKYIHYNLCDNCITRCIIMVFMYYYIYSCIHTLIILLSCIQFKLVTLLGESSVGGDSRVSPAVGGTRGKLQSTETVTCERGQGATAASGKSDGGEKFVSISATDSSGCTSGGGW